MIDTSEERDEVERLRSENERLRSDLTKWKRIRTPTHGTCCTCQACGLDYDSCRCYLDDLADENDRLREEVDRLKMEKK
jgi:hypothetical protein